MNFFAEIMGIVRSGSDWLWILIFLAAGFGFGTAMGRHRLNLVALGGYFSFLIVKFMPWKEFGFLGTGAAPPANIQIFLFFAVILAIFFFAPYSAFSSVAKISGRGKASWWQLAIFGMLELGFLASAVISFLPAKTLADLSPFIKDFFADELMLFLWLFLPVVAMFFLKSKRLYSASEE